MKPTRLNQVFFSTILLGAIIPVTGAIFFDRYTPNWLWEHYPFHAMVEVVGAFTALILGTIIAMLQRHKRLDSRYLWVAVALFVMGILDGFHATFHASQTFVWLHSVATMAGGVGFALAMLPKDWTETRIPRITPQIMLTTAIAFGVGSSMFQEWIPIMTTPEGFTITAKAINFIGGISFMAGWFYFVRQYVIEKEMSQLFLAHHCMLFGVAGFLFGFSTLWDATWWLWHVLRLIAYLILLVYFMLLYNKDIRSIRNSQASLSKVQEMGSIGTWELDIKTNKLIWADQNYKNFGVPSGTPLTYEKFLDCVHPDDREYVDTEWMAALDGNPYDIEHRIIADGKVKCVREKADVEFDKEGNCIRAIGFTQDITERKRAEEQRLALEAQLRQKQKLESIGTLAGGVAHEINNPINGIMNYAQLISDQLDPESPLREFTDEIGQETERVAKIVRNLLAFARHEKESHSPARIVDIVDGTVSLVRTIIRRDQITLEVDVPDDLPKIKCRSQQIQQVLMNLLTNARDALNERYPEHDPDKIMTVTVRPFEKEGRSWLRTTVEDHGAGIPDEIRDRLFDPFFTTKDQSKGTGLGMSISHGIVQDHHGELSVECEAGRYTRFHLDLPVDNDWSLDEASEE